MLVATNQDVMFVDLDVAVSMMFSLKKTQPKQNMSSVKPWISHWQSIPVDEEIQLVVVPWTIGPNLVHNQQSTTTKPSMHQLVPPS